MIGHPGGEVDGVEGPDPGCSELEGERQPAEVATHGDDRGQAFCAELEVWTHGAGNVVAIRQNNQWTVDAPPGAYAPVLLRGYTMGEYLGQNMSSLEVEERYRLAERWTATLFAGVACLYGDGVKCNDSDNLYPSAGLGVQYLLKPQQGLVANLEFAQAKDGDNAVIFKMGYSW